MRPSPVPALLSVALIVVVSACAAPPSPPMAVLEVAAPVPVIVDAPVPTPGLLVRIDMQEPSSAVVAGPSPSQLSIYEDGLVLHGAPGDASYPGPAWTPAAADQLAPSDLAQLRQILDASDLGVGPGDYGAPDSVAPHLTVVTLVDAGGAVVHEALALGWPVTEPAVTAEQVAARQRLIRLIGQVRSVADRAAPGGGHALWTPDRLRVTAVPVGQIDPASYDATPRAWPVAGVDLAATPACLTVTGDLVDEVIGALGGALDLHEQDGIPYQVQARALLPDEPAC